MATRDFVNHCHDGSSLIVDFPPAPRQRVEPRRHHAVSTDDSTATIEVAQPVTKRPKVRSVSFSATSEMALIPSKSEQDIRSSWYSKEDKTHQKKMVLRNAAEVSRRLETGTDDPTDEDLCKTVGMDNFMTPHMIRMSKIEKQRHAQCIVFAQARFDPDLLSRLSKRSSLPSRQRAYERALSQF
eukprot:scaffold2251_cov139-Skeletonema_dohrnii-CCMP3373.AAC.4